MSGCAAEVQPSDQKGMPAIAMGIVCLFGGLGISSYVLAACLLVEEGIGIDTLGLPKAVGFSALGVVVGIRISAWLRLSSRANCMGALSMSLLALALWGFILEFNAGLANAVGMAAGRQLGGGALSVSALENILWAWLFFPGFLLQGIVVHLLFNAYQRFGAGISQDGSTFVATYVAGISLGCMAAWLSSLSAEVFTLASMIACLIAALASWIYIGAEGRDASRPASPACNTRKTSTFAALFAIGFALVVAGSMGDWLLGLLLGPFAGRGMAAGVFAGGISFGIWSGRFSGKRPLDSRHVVGIAVMSGIAALAVSGLYGSFLSMKSIVVEWVKFRGADFYAPFFQAYAFFAAMVLVFPLATILGRAILILGSSDQVKGFARAHPVDAALFILAGAATGPILMGDMLLPHIGVKSAFFVFAAFALLCSEFSGAGATAEAKPTHKRYEFAGTACILLLAIVFPLYPLHYAISVGILGGMVAYVMPSIDSCLTGSARKRASTKLLGCSLALSIAFAGPVDQRNYFFLSTSPGYNEATDEATAAARRQLIYSSQARKSNLQFFSDSAIVAVTLVANGIERDVFQKRGLLPPPMEPAILAGILPILYHPEGGRVAVAGLSLGSLRTLLSFPEIEQVETIARDRAAFDGLVHGLSRLSGDMLPQTPDPSLAILSDSRHSMVRESPKAYFSVQVPGLYDAVVLGGADLADPYDSPQFSRKFYSQVSNALSTEGIFVQRVRMRSISGRDLPVLIKAIGDEFGDYVLYTSQEELIVVASKRGQILPAISGKALREHSDEKSPSSLIGLLDIEYVTAHRLGGRKLFDPYFHDMRPRNFSASRIHPSGSLFLPNGFALLKILNSLNFPLLALMEGTKLPEPQISDTSRRYTWEALKFAYALSLYEHFFYGKWDKSRFRQGDAPRIARILEAKVCPSRLEGWVELVADLGAVMALLNPHLNIDKMVHLWKEIDEGCLGRDDLPVDVALFVNYYRALSTRDFGGILLHGEAILMSGGMASEMGKGVLAALVVAGQKQGQGAESMALLLRYLPHLDLSGVELARFVGAGVLEDIPAGKS